MSALIPSFAETVLLSAEEAAEVRNATREAEAELQEDIWGQQGILIAEDQDQFRFYIKPLANESSSASTKLLSCPLTAIMNAQDNSSPLNMQQCFFRANAISSEVAEEVWLQQPASAVNSEECEHQGFVFTSNAQAKRPFCHVRLLSMVTDNVECSTFNMPIRAADMVLGRPCSLEYDMQIDQRTGRLKPVATKLCFKLLEGLITKRSSHGVVIEPTEQIKYRADARPMLTIFAAFDRCATIQPLDTLVGSRVFYHLQGPVAAPEACDWQVEGGIFHPKWKLPFAPQLRIESTSAEISQSVRWFPWHPDEPALVVASDPKFTKFRDDAFECKLDEEAGSGFLRVHIVNMASRFPRDSPQEKWMRRVLCRHHPADAEDTRSLFANWASTSAGIGFVEQEHRPALTMQLNMKLIEDGWAVHGPASFFESMVRLSVKIDSEKVSEEWVNKVEDAATPESLILYPLNSCSELEQAVQQVFHDAQIVRENRWRRLDADGQRENSDVEDCKSDDSQVTEEGDQTDAKLPKLWCELNYNSNARTFSLLVEELQPSHFFAKQILNIMNSEVFRVLDGYKELFGFGDCASVDDLEARHSALAKFLSDIGIKNPQDGEPVTTFEELEEFVWKDLGGSPSELYEAMGWGAYRKKMVMMADLRDGARCHFEFTKPGRLYTQLVSQRLFLDFVRNGMRRPRRMSYGMTELRGLMTSANKRQELNDKMVHNKNMALLKTAWPQIMAHGGLPAKGVVVEEGVVYVWPMKEPVECPALANVVPPVPPGTKVIVQLQKLHEQYTAAVLAIHGRLYESGEKNEGQLSEECQSTGCSSE